MMAPEEEQAKRQIVKAAKAMLDGKVDLLEGCRLIVKLRPWLNESDLSDPDLMVAVVVASELDDVPGPLERDLWESRALAEKDEQKEQYVETMREEVLRACRAVERKWIV